MTTRAVRFIRKSKGQDDDVGLQQQREKTKKIAEELADEHDTVDLGIHTGFSIHERAPDEPRIDANEEVQQLLEDLGDGKYDYLVAWDDTRLARDNYFYRFVEEAKKGDCDIIFHDDEIDRENLSFDVMRQVETHVKQKEIEKSKKAKEKRRKWGCWDGPVPTGLEYDSNTEYLVKDSVEWQAIEKVLEMRDDGASYGEIVDKTGIPKGTVSRILDRREWYEWLDRDEDVVIAKDGPACKV